MHFLYWYNILIILGMLSSIPYFFVGDNQQRRKHLVIFLILVVISVVEALGKYKALLSQNNTIIYNVGYVFIVISLKIYFFNFVFHTKREKSFVSYLMALFIIWWLINFLFIQPIHNFHYYSLAFGSLIIIGTSFYFFYGIFFKNWYLEKNLLAVPEFWIISFLMFFYSASLLYFISFSFYFEKMDTELFLQLNFLIRILGVMMYLVLGLSFYAPRVFKEIGNR